MSFVKHNIFICIHHLHLVGIALVDEKALPLSTKGHLRRVLGHQGVEEGVELVDNGALLGAQDAPQPLGLLPPRTAMAGDLDEHVGLGQVEAGVRHLAHKDGVHLEGCRGLYCTLSFYQEMTVQAWGRENMIM